MIYIGRADYTMSQALRTLALALRRSLKRMDGERSDLDDARYMHEVTGWLFDPSTVVLMATMDKAPCGFLTFQSGNLAGASDVPTVTIRGMYVTDEAKAAGVPGLLYRKAFRFARQVGVSRAQVMIRWGHEEVAELAHRHGFEPVAAVLQLELSDVKRRRNLRPGPVEEVHAAGAVDGAGS